MSEQEQGDVASVERLAWIIRAFALTLPISIALAEPLGYLAVLVATWLAIRPRNRRSIEWHPIYWALLAYFAIAVFSTVYSIRPGVSAAKLPRLLLMGLIPATGSLYFRSGHNGAKSLALAFLAGCVLRAVYHVVHVLVLIPRGLNPFDLGNMRDPQMYLTASLLLIGFLIYDVEKAHRRWAWTSIGLTTLGLVLNFKRGAWIAALVAFLLVIGLARKWRWLVAVVLFAGMLWIIPWTRERIEQSRQEFSIRWGGRYALWHEVAPPMLRQYPQGVGYAASRNVDFVRFAPRVQPGLHHLHNNVLQVALELGWAGLVAWLWWVVGTLVLAWKTFQNVRQSEPAAAAVCLGALGGLIGLVCNGLVEYNFGDSEILMLWYLLSGLIILVERQTEREAT